MGEPDEYAEGSSPSQTSVPVSQEPDQALADGTIVPSQGPAKAPPVEEQEEHELPSMTIGEHLDELRKRLFYSVLGLFAALGITLYFGKDIIHLIEQPFMNAMRASGEQPQLAVTEVTAGFYTYIKVAVYAALVLSSPWIFYQLWAFVAAGLYPRERRYVNLAVPFSVALFLGGAAFAVVISIPAIEFFIEFGSSLDLVPIITLPDYISFMTGLLLAFGVVFQVPLVVLVLARVGLVDMRRLKKYRRHVIVAIAGVSALLAPPDVMSMVLMAVPMWLLYELGVALAWVLIFKKRRPESPQEEQT